MSWNFLLPFGSFTIEPIIEARDGFYKCLSTPFWEFHSIKYNVTMGYEVNLSTPFWEFRDTTTRSLLEHGSIFLLPFGSFSSKLAWKYMYKFMKLFLLPFGSF